MNLGANIARSATCSTVRLFLPAALPVIQIPYFSEEAANKPVPYIDMDTNIDIN
jgi:hypothetical protein